MTPYVKYIYIYIYIKCERNKKREEKCLVVDFFTVALSNSLSIWNGDAPFQFSVLGLPINFPKMNRSISTRGRRLSLVAFVCSERKCEKLEEKGGDKCLSLLA